MPAKRMGPTLVGGDRKANSLSAFSPTPSSPTTDSRLTTMKSGAPVSSLTAASGSPSANPSVKAVSPAKPRTRSPGGNVELEVEVVENWSGSGTVVVDRTVVTGYPVVATEPPGMPQPPPPPTPSTMARRTAGPRPDPTAAPRPPHQQP